jgi:acetyl esterase/lipase
LSVDQSLVNVCARVVLIVGGRDIRIDVKNSEYYYKRLKSLGKCCDLYSVPEGVHFFVSPRARLAHLFLTLKAFLLKGDA